MIPELGGREMFPREVEMRPGECRNLSATRDEIG